MIQVQSRVLVIIRLWLCVLLAWLASTAPQARHRGLLQVYDLPGGCRLEPAVQYAHSAACHQSLRGIATVVLPNRPADAEAGGSGAAGGLGWAVQTRRLHNGGDYGESASEHDRFQHTYSIRRVLKLLNPSCVYDIVYNIVAISYFCIRYTDMTTMIS